MKPGAAIALPGPQLLLCHRPGGIVVAQRAAEDLEHLLHWYGCSCCKWGAFSLHGWPGGVGYGLRARSSSAVWRVAPRQSKRHWPWLRGARSPASAPSSTGAAGQGRSIWAWQPLAAPQPHARRRRQLAAAVRDAPQTPEAARHVGSGGGCIHSWDIPTMPGVLPTLQKNKLAVTTACCTRCLLRRCRELRWRRQLRPEWTRQHCLGASQHCIRRQELGVYRRRHRPGMRGAGRRRMPPSLRQVAGAVPLCLPALSGGRHLMMAARRASGQPC